MTNTFLISLSTGAQPRSVEKAIFIDDKSEGTSSAGRENEFKDEILPFAQLGVDLGVDYAVIKHCSDDEEGSLGVDYSKYEDMYPLMEQAEKLSNDQTKVIVKWSKIFASRQVYQPTPKQQSLLPPMSYLATMVNLDI